MYIDPTLIAGAGLTAFDHRKKLFPALRKLRYWLRRGQLRIAIFGPGGTGKTTLGQFLSGKLDFSATKYKQSVEVEEFSLKGDFVCTLIVPPGQARRAITTWPSLYRSLAEGKSAGVINVVCAGYHSFAEGSYQETKYFTPGMSKAEFLQTYLRACRERELEIIADLTPRLLDAKQRIWMITLVTKQDLWWNDRAGVEDLYENSQYNEFIKRITHERGAQHFQHEYMSASLLINNLVTSAGEVLATTTAGYDQNIQYTHLQLLTETVNNFANR